MSNPLTRMAGLLLLVWLASPNGLAAQPQASAGAARWWKGNLHTHSLWSDGDDFPEMIADWYKRHGYHFLALTDHNLLSEGEKWVPMQRIYSLDEQ